MTTEYGSSTIPLSKTTKFIVDNRGRTAPTAWTGTALIATNCISNDQLYPIYENIRYVSDETYRNWFRSHPQPGDIILTLKGSQNGAVCLVPDPVDFAIAQDMVALRADDSIIDPLFLFAALRSPLAQWQIKNLDVSGVIPHLKKTDFDKLFLPYPERSIQTRIGETYFNLCLKIEQNRRTGRKLEELARAVFKAWFVDFEPVKAKAAGATAFPGMPPETFASLPKTLKDSPLGPVPEGWGVGSLGDLLKERGERITPGDETQRLPYVPIDCITSKRVTLETFKSGEEAQSSLILFQEGDILFGAMRPYFHKVCLAPFAGTTRTTCFVLVPHTNSVRAYALILASEDTTVQFATTHSVGSTIPYAKWQSSLNEMPCVLPPESFRAAFEMFAGPMLKLSNQGVAESAKLADLRDYLLPRLLSGRVRVGLTKQLPLGETI